jgi:hypothetical protein
MVDQRQVVRMLAVARVAIGVAATAMPGVTGSLLFGPKANSPALRLVTRSFGARDVVIGLGTLRALDQDVDAAGWARASAASDAADAVAALIAARAVPTARALLGAGSAAVAAIGGYRAASRLG